MKIAFLNYSPSQRERTAKNSKTNNKENIKEVFDTCSLKIKNICVAKNTVVAAKFAQSRSGRKAPQRWQPQKKLKKKESLETELEKITKQI